MTKQKHYFRRKGYILLIAFFVILSLTGYNNFPQSTCPECGFGDIPLDKETYQQFLKPVYPDDSLKREGLPALYDARTYGIVTPAKNQNSCGSCWAFASVGAVESHLLKEGLHFSPTDLSEQQQISCNTSMHGCCGGNSTALRYWETVGSIYETCYPYGDGSGVTNCPNAPYSNVACTTTCPQLSYRATNYYTVPTNQFKESLYEDGPSYWRFDVYDDFYNFYSYASQGSVYTQTSGSYLGGHAVLLIGWDDSKGAYLCKNSWGATSGPQSDGTFWIAYSGHAHNLNFQMANFDIVPLNQAPVANAGPDQGVDPNTLVTLNGSGSYDPDGNIPITFQWEQTSGTLVSLSNITISNPTFTSPASQETLTFQLVVTDSEDLASIPDYVNILNGDIPLEHIYLPLIY